MCLVITKNPIMQGADSLPYVQNEGTDKLSACRKVVMAEWR
jgi:hypothetical protein